MTVPATRSTATEPTASAEKRGTARAASGQRSGPARRSPPTSIASPPAQSAAAPTCATSATWLGRPSVRAWPARAGVATRGAASTASASTGPRPAPRRAASERERGDACGEQRLDEPDPAEARVEHGLERLRPHGVAERKRARDGGLEHDAGDSRCDQPDRGDSDPGYESTADGGPGGFERPEQDDRAAGDEEQQPEVERAGDRGRDGDAPACRLVDLCGDAGRVRARRADVEDERAGERVRVGRDDTPGDRVGALGELVRDATATVRPSGAQHVAAIDPRRVPRIHAHGAERRLDGLAESQRDLPRSRGADRVVRRLGCDEDGVACRRGRMDERRDCRERRASCDGEA